MSKLLEQLKRHEGFRKTPYKCSAGKWTIGYGCNLDAIGVDPEGLVWNESYAEHVLKTETQKIKRQVSMGLNNDHGGYYESLTDCRFDVLVNMVFNLGRVGVSEFRKMWSAIDEEDYETAANEMIMSKWAKQVGSRATELSEQMRTGTWQF